MGHVLLNACTLSLALLEKFGLPGSTVPFQDGRVPQAWCCQANCAQTGNRVKRHMHAMWGLAAAHPTARCVCPGSPRQQYRIKHETIKQSRIQNDVSSLLRSKPNHRVRQSSLSLWLYYSTQHKATSAKEGEGKSFQAGPWWDSELQGQRRCGLSPVGQATVVLTNTSKLSFFFFFGSSWGCFVQSRICWGCSGTIWLARWTGDT